MIEGKKAPSPTPTALGQLTQTMKEPDADEGLLESYGIPVLFSVVQSSVQLSIRAAGFSREVQGRWYKI